MSIGQVGIILPKSIGCIEVLTDRTIRVFPFSVKNSNLINERMTCLK